MFSLFDCTTDSRSILYNIPEYFIVVLIIKKKTVFALWRIDILRIDVFANYGHTQIFLHWH